MPIAQAAARIANMTLQERMWATAFKHVCKTHNVPALEMHKIVAAAKRSVINSNRNRDNFR
jgi:hypothetical protein